MTSQEHIRLTSFPRSFLQAVSIFGILVGSRVLIGWELDIPELKSALPCLVTLKNNATLTLGM